VEQETQKPIVKTRPDPEFLSNEGRPAKHVRAFSNLVGVDFYAFPNKRSLDVRVSVWRKNPLHDCYPPAIAPTPTIRTALTENHAFRQRRIDRIVRRSSSPQKAAKTAGRCA